MCAAIFDAILVYMMNTIAPIKWMSLREEMCNKLNRHKTKRTVEILETVYGDADVQFLQEVAGSFAENSKNYELSKKFEVFFSESMDVDRDQNSFILLKKNKYENVVEVTSEVIKILKSRSKDAPVMDGDLLVLSVMNIQSKTNYLLASFHGDTNGLATIPVLDAVHDYAVNIKPDHKLLFGMDANTYAYPEPNHLGVTEFAKYYTSKNMNSCYGPNPNPLNFTTFHARTFLQPQLNKVR
jgi:hypothetical protein